QAAGLDSKTAMHGRTPAKEQSDRRPQRFNCRNLNRSWQLRSIAAFESGRWLGERWDRRAASVLQCPPSGEPGACRIPAAIAALAHSHGREPVVGDQLWT